jgi:hypothetical protein
VPKTAAGLWMEPVWPSVPSMATRQSAWGAWSATVPCTATGNVNLVAGRDVIAFYEHLGYKATDSSFMVKRLR